MLGNQLKTGDLGTAFLDSLLDEFRCKVELIAKLAADIKNLIMILHNANTAEHNHALEMEKPSLCIWGSFVHHAERDLVVPLDGINLMPLACAVEIDAAIGFRIVEIKGDSIGIIIIPENGEDTPHLAL